MGHNNSNQNEMNISFNRNVTSKNYFTKSLFTIFPSLLFSLILFFGVIGNLLGQSPVTIGTGTTSSKIPFTTFNNSTISEQIYLNTELNTGGPVNISSIAFYSGDLSTAQNTSPVIRIWMKSASATTLSTGAYSLSGYYLVLFGGYTSQNH
jgi:hypothetical protein